MADGDKTKRERNPMYKYRSDGTNQTKGSKDINTEIKRGKVNRNTVEKKIGFSIRKPNNINKEKVDHIKENTQEKNKESIKHDKRIKEDSHQKKETDRSEIIININNICGDKNDIKLNPGEISISEEELMELSKDSIKKVIDTIKHISEESLENIPNITIPIYIFNINNILTSGKKNETNFK